MIAFIDCLHYGYIAISCMSVALFIIIHVISNILHFKDAKFALYAIAHYIAYDVVLSFPIGVNVTAFSVASLFYLKMKKIYKDSINAIHYIIFGAIFFGTKTLIQYVATERLNWQFLVCQVALFSICSIVFFYFLNKKVNSDDSNYFAF